MPSDSSLPNQKNPPLSNLSTAEKASEFSKYVLDLAESESEDILFVLQQICFECLSNNALAECYDDFLDEGGEIYLDSIDPFIEKILTQYIRSIQNILSEKNSETYESVLNSLREFTRQKIQDMSPSEKA